MPQVHRIAVRDGESLAIDWYPAGSGAPAAVCVHGLGSHRRGEKAVHFARRLNEHGWACASIDLRGHGESDGDVRALSMSGMLADVAAAAAWIGERASGPVTMIGASMGAAVIAWHAAADPERAGPLVMIAPSLRFPAGLADALGPRAVAQWRRTGLRRFESEWIDLEIGYGLIEDGERYDPAILASRHATSTLIIHGMRDETVDWRTSARFARDCPAPCVDLFLVKQGDHRLTDQKELLFGVLWSWLQQRAGR